MKNSQRAKLIFLTCMLVVGIFSVIIICRSLRPSPGKLYEKIDVEQAIEYMEYEEDYIICDVTDAESFQSAHIRNAVNMPYDQLGTTVMHEIPDLEKQIYIYARDRKTSDKAATKLCEMGYVNVTEVGILEDWKTYSDMIVYAAG